MKKILVFAPHSAIWVHAFPEALALEALKQSGYEIVYLTCGETFENYCISMSASIVSRNATLSQKKKICEICNENKNIIKKYFNFSGYDFGDVLSHEDWQEIERILSSVNRDNYLDLVIDGIEVGRFSLYQLLLEKKKFSLDFSLEEWEIFLVELKNSLITFFANRKILENEKPQFVVVYNPHYSINRMVFEQAERRGILVYFLHSGGNLSNRLETLQIGHGMPFKFYRLTLEHWKTWKTFPCGKQSLSMVTDHFLELFLGFNVFAYSSPKKGRNIYDYFRIESNCKILVATLSSYDERFAAETVKAYPPPNPKLFPTQVEWLKELISFVKNREDLFLIIRIHPREFPNKRDSEQSDHSKQLVKVLSELPANVRVNWPQDNISLYDLAEYADVFLNAWSSAGKEMSLLGIPVVIYSDDRLTYPVELNYLGTTRETYFSQIERALKDGWSFEKVRMTYRWYVHDFERSVISLSESFTMRESVTMSFWGKIFDKFMRRLVSPHYRKICDCLKREKELKAKSLIAAIFDQKADMILNVREKDSYEDEIVSIEHETEYLISELKRMSKAMSGNQNPGSGHSKLMLQFSRVAGEKYTKAAYE